MANDTTRGRAQHTESDKDEYSSSGRGWHGDSEGHAQAGRKGGQKVSLNRDHMANIGRKGGEAVSRDREHMAEIGRRGGQARGESGSPRTRGKQTEPSGEKA